MSGGILGKKLHLFLFLAKVVPVYKNKGETCIPGNYRPISLFSIFDKLLEKVMHARFYSYLFFVKHIIYCTNINLVFVKKSTSMALIDVIEKILSIKTMVSCVRVFILIYSRRLIR